MKIKNNLKVFILLAIGSLLLILSWFREGYIYGGGDVGLQTYNPQRVFEIARYIWWESIAPGLPVPQGLTALPFSIGFSILQYFGFSPLLFQASLFFMILLFMSYGMYLLLSSFIQDKKYVFIGVFFYVFNPYMMIQVWHRFVHSTFFLIAALPFLAIFWLLWIRQKRVISLLGFLITNLIFLYAYGTIAYILTVWIFILLLTLLEIVFPWKGFKNTYLLMALFIAGFAMWVITNIWWLVPIFNISPGLLSMQHSNSESLTTLINLAKQSIVPFLIQMINPFYLFSQLDFGSFYLNILVRLIPLIFFGLIFIGIITGIRIREFAKWIILYLIIVFLAKGAASPLGYFFVWGFENFFALGVLRNPFEKIGVILPLVSSIVLVVGISELSKFLSSKKMFFLKKVLIPSLIILDIIFCWPMFSGKIFGRFDKPEYVKVPQSYSDANNWIISDNKKDKIKNPGNILHLPLTIGESITYNWQYGYNGLESSALFFTDAPSISHGFNIKQIDDVLSSVYRSLNNPEYKDISLKLIKKLNIKYIILHKDVKWQETGLINPNETEKYLNMIDFIELVAQFGELRIYKIKDNLFGPRIYFANNFKLIYPENTSVDNLSVWRYIEDADLIQFNPKGLDNESLQKSNKIILPSHDLPYSQISESDMESFLNNIASDVTYENQYFESFNRVRDILKQNGEIKAVNKMDEILISEKKIINILKHIYNKQVINILDIKDYEDNLHRIFYNKITDSRLLLYLNNSEIGKIFQPHIYILGLISTNGQKEIKRDAELVKAFLEKNMLENNLTARYPLENISLGKEGVIYSYIIPQDGVYKLTLEIDQENDNKDKISKQDIFIDGDKKTLPLSIDLTSGIHEIFLPIEKVKPEENKKNNDFEIPILYKESDASKSNIANNSSVFFKQNSPINYSGHIRVENSNVLIFSQTYSPGWKLTLRDQKGNYELKKHFVSNFFGNAFFIDRIGDYEFNLIYDPQSMVDYGMIVSTVMYVALGFYVFLIERRVK